MGTVLHVRIATGTGGGPEKTILNSPRHLAALGYRSLVAYLHPPDDAGFEVLKTRAAEKDCPLVGLPESLLIDPRVLWKLARLCRQESVTIWHGHDYKSNFYGLLLRPFVGFQVLSTVHGWVRHTRRTPLYYAIDRWCLGHQRAVICVSQDLFEKCSGLGLAPERLHLVENAIDTEEFKRKTQRPRAGRIRIGAVGRLSEEKGFGFLIEAVERLIERGFDISLAIAGEGELFDELEARMQSSAHAERLELLGFQADTRALFEGFDLFCLSSLREGLPNVVLEAMAMEVPVLATRSGGMQAFARDGVDALLVEPGSPDELEAGLARLLENPGQARSLASAARSRVQRETSFSARMARVAAIYDSLTGSARS